MKHGFAAIAGVLVMVAVLGSLIFVSMFLSIGESQMGLDLLRAERTLALAEGCAESALLSAKVDETYDEGTIALPEGECSVSVERNGTEWAIEISATHDGFLKKVEIVFDRQLAGITLSRWQEIP